ncbi:hypothetical protein DS745_13010 [Anaerobacillus alkaliphilus]|uniref:Uncharacterized protein n=1 Tax=Anaerobacillus alkaliphilus TaxID=1548597 RepID=A0A4V1LG96_9BACI|nr:hypothetical protein [Anaerobacillus alkaliphilus]RXI99801.1 hypothetical protein DS745_13010 [Anaerobacillus alkaliphilus]
MSSKKEVSFLDLVKVVGERSEKKIRKCLHSILEDEKTVELIKHGLNKHSNTLQSLRKNTETISQQLNLPTKNDVSNIAKIGLQIEEKIDALEEKIYHLTEQLQNQDVSTTSKLPETTNEDHQLRNDRKELRRLLKTNLLLGNITNQDTIIELLNSINSRGDKRD